MSIAYINERHDRVLWVSTPVFGATKDRITEELNKILLDKGLPAVKGKVGVGFKVKHEPYSFDVSEKQPTK